jgi:RHS repeat-associated protein
VRTYGKGNRLERVTTLGSSIAYEYDASGCVVRKTTTTARDERTLRLQWNSRRQLVAAILPDGERWEYAYDGLGRRLRKQSSSGDVVRYVWDGFRVLHEIQNGVCRSWTYLPRSAVPVLAEDGVTRAVLVDRVGAPSELVGPAGIDRVLRKGTWGEAMPGGDDAPDQPFMGQWRDEETGLHYNVFRYYDPDAGRYLSPDPIELEGGTNAYAFVPSPFGWVDPLGLAAKKCAGPTDEQVEHAVENIDGLTPDQARKLMEASFKRDSTIVFGGSRVRGDAHEGSDLDVGFGSLSASQASKILGNEDLNTPLSLEQTRIVPGNKPPRIDPAIDTPEGFFARSGNRTDPGREGEPFSPSGSITYGPDGSITDNRIK